MMSAITKMMISSGIPMEPNIIEILEYLRVNDRSFQAPRPLLAL
jgi:hypothetical protein